MKVLRERLLPLPVVAKILDEESRKRSLSSVESVALEFARKFSRLPPEAAEGLVSELVGMGLPVEVAVQVVNILPESEGELRTILAPLSRVFTGDELRAILSKIKAAKGGE